MTWEAVADFGSIVWLDVVLSGDNALIIGLAAAGLSPVLRRRAIIFGLVLATVVRIFFASVTTYLMSVPGLLFVGGLLLLWVSWRLYSECRAGMPSDASYYAEDVTEIHEDMGYTGPPRKSLRSALVTITVADISMSVDNVLAVAAIARENVILLVFGLALSICLMGLAATLVLKFLTRYPWVSYMGVAFLVYVAGEMLWDGSGDVVMGLGHVMEALVL
jgi:YjbE family integral membrane protein